MNSKALFFTLLIFLTAYFVWHREGPYKADFPQFWLAKEMDENDNFLQYIAGTVKNLPDIGDYISNISVERGLRSKTGELAGSDEVKISINLDWQSMPGESIMREILDHTAALIITEVFYQHNKISKLRVLIKIPKKRKNVREANMGKSLGYKNAAKVFSITRAAWELALNQQEYDYNPVTLQGAANILALGDYVVLTDDGWARGY